MAFSSRKNDAWIQSAQINVVRHKEHNDHENPLTHLMLRPKANDALFQEFIHGRLIGRSEERNRTRKFFHDLLSSKILAASFLAHAAHDKLSFVQLEATQACQ